MYFRIAVISEFSEVKKAEEIEKSLFILTFSYILVYKTSIKLYKSISVFKISL